MGSDRDEKTPSDPGPVTWKEGRKPKRPDDAEWEALAAEVAAELQSEESVDDEATELYDEVHLEEFSDPEVVVITRKPDVTTEVFDMLVQPASVELDEPITEEIAEIELDEPEALEVPWQGLHAASIVVNLIPRTWKVLAGFWPLFLAVLIGAGSFSGIGVDTLGWVLLFLGSGAISTLIHYVTLRYRVQGGKLEIRQGLLNKQARIIDPARIQNVELVRNVFHRMSGLVEVRIETAGDTRTEGLLSALHEDDAERLMEVLGELRGSGAPPPNEEELEPLLTLGPGELLAFGLSRARAGLVVVLFAVAFELLPFLTPEQTEQTFDTARPGFVAGLVLLAFALSWGGSALLAVLRHHGFRLVREPGRLWSREGLLTERRVEIPLGKVQLVMADEPIVRRLMGFGTLSVETAGLGSVQEGVKAAELVVPMVDRVELASVVRAAIPATEVDPWRDRLAPAHRRALWRMLVAGLVKWSALSIPVALLWQPWGAFALVLPVLSIFANVLDWRYQGWLVTPGVIVARRGFWRRRTWVLARDKIQSVHLVQGPFMRWHGLGRLAVRVAGSQVILPDVGWPVAEGLLDELKPMPELALE
ncbi:MAG TPA: PH domain-containing protein [Myxococcota bacterium]|nr:PH domain-containing protein [Myxococcota bacterium]